MTDENQQGSNEYIGKANFAFQCGIDIAGHHFSGLVGYVNGNVAVYASWAADGRQPLGLHDLVKCFGIQALPEIEALSFGLSKASFSYCAQTVSLEVETGSGEKVTLTGGASFYSMSLSFDNGGLALRFRELPILGSILSDSDNIMLEMLSASYEATTKQMRFSVCGKLSLYKNNFPIPPDDYPQKSSTETDGDSGKADAAEPEVDTPSVSGQDKDITWIDVNKKISVLRIGRIGFSFLEDKISLHLDAGFSVSILSAEFLGLRIGIPLKGSKFDFGLDGLVISLNKPPLSITGGLYSAGGSDEVLYNGMLKLKFKDIAITALGSYAEVRDEETGEKTTSIFIYAALLTPLGGPPCFYITGIALGFGINRAVNMPKLEDVPAFPLVQTVMGTGQLKAGDSPESALSALSNHIKPSPGNYFAAVGIKFTSFNIATSFALMIVEFGGGLKISLLGQSVITMPPNAEKSQKPMMYAELAVRAVLDFNEGYFEVLGALTNESYILDDKCKLQGGFAFALWTKGDRAGDFIVTLGGCHHPLFESKKSLYPSVEKVGINWAITDKLSLKGLGYFAVTQSCVMAGCEIAVNYISGSLKAWLNAQASFYMSWKPFHYDVSISISMGVSYSFTLLFWTVTLKIELGASLHLWGPAFSGCVTIDLSVISFTVNFGAAAKQTPPAIGWDEFRNSFLPKELAAAHGQTVKTDGDAAAVCSVTFTNGQLAEGRDVESEDTVFISPAEFTIVTRSEIPATVISLQHKELVSGANTVLCVAPMRRQNVKCTQSVIIERCDGGEIPEDTFEAVVLRENMSAALWGLNPGPGSDTVKNLITGLEIRVRGSKLAGSLNDYNIADLAEYTTRKGNGWGSADTLESRKDTTFAPDMVSKSKSALDANAALLKERFPHLVMPCLVQDGNGIYDKPMDYFWATPKNRRMGEKWQDG